MAAQKTIVSSNAWKLIEIAIPFKLQLGLLGRLVERAVVIGYFLLRMHRGSALVHWPSDSHLLERKSPGLTMKSGSQEYPAMEPTSLPLVIRTWPFSGSANGGQSTTANTQII